MKKKALSLISLLLVMMLGVLASCDKEEEITNNGSTDNTTGTVTETENVKEEHSVLNNNYDKTIVLEIISAVRSTQATAITESLSLSPTAML